MQFAIVCFPTIESRELQEFRGKYDPKSRLIPPHITLVFPVNSKIGHKALIKHIEKTITNTQSFSIILEGTYLANDNYLYLLISKGQEKIIAVHDNLYTDVLAQYLRTDVKFIPHLTIGYFERNKALDENQYRLANKELENSTFKFEVVFDNINLIQINDIAKERKVIKRFNF